MKEQTRENPKILAAAERQMQAWSLHEQLEDKALREHDWEQPIGQIQPFVAVSREAGAGGSEVARRVAEKLGWRLWDKNLLDHVAERFHLSRAMLDVVDETQSNWVYDVLGTWMDRKVVPHEKYVSYLGRVVLSLARRHPSVLVGRGGQFLLPRNKGLVVRIIAPEKLRVERLMLLRGLSAADARRCMEETDRGRAEFVERFFHHDIADAQLYDLVINTERLGIDGAVRQILAAADRP